MQTELSLEVLLLTLQDSSFKKTRTYTSILLPLSQRLHKQLDIPRRCLNVIDIHEGGLPCCSGSLHERATRKVHLHDPLKVS